MSLSPLLHLAGLQEVAGIEFCLHAGRICEGVCPPLKLMLLQGGGWCQHPMA